MTDKKEILTMEIINRIEKLKEKEMLDFSKLLPIYTMEFLANYEEKYKTLNKMIIIGRLLYDYDKMKDIILNLKWTLFNDKFKPYKNDYGLLFTRLEMFFELEFFDLPLEDQINITLVEIFNGFSKSGSQNEALLGLCRFGFFDYNSIYAQIKRNSLSSIIEEKGVTLPILFSRSLKVRKFMKNYHIENNQVDEKGNVTYFFITKFNGWYCGDDWTSYFNELKKGNLKVS